MMSLLQNSSFFKRSYLLGVKGKLYAAIFLIMVLTLVLSGLSWQLFQTANVTLDVMTQKVVPAMMEGKKITTTIEKINEGILKLTYVEDSKDLEDQCKSLMKLIQFQKGLIEEVQEIENFKSLAQEISFSKILNKNTEIIEKKVSQINKLMHDILSLKIKLESDRALLTSLEIDFSDEVVALADDAYFQVMMHLGDQQKETQSEFFKVHSLKDQVNVLNSILEVKSQGDSLVGLLYIGMQSLNEEEVNSIKERFDSESINLNSNLQELLKYQSETYIPLTKLIEKIFALGMGGNNFFELRSKYLHNQKKFNVLYDNIKTIGQNMGQAEAMLSKGILNRVHEFTFAAENNLEFGKTMMLYGAFFVVSFSFLIGWGYIGRNIIRRITLLGKHMLEIADGKFSNEIPQEGNDEITEMARAVLIFRKNMQHNQQLTQELQKSMERTESAKAQIQAMNVDLEKRVEQRTCELQKTNEDLQSTLVELKQIQTELVESEKMASLGRLVSGVSHEINTPVGNAITAVSGLKDRWQMIERAHQEGDLSKSKFEDFIKVGSRIVDLVIENLDRTSKLVATFKQISVDEHSEKRKQFNLRELLTSVIQKLEERFESKTYWVELECDEHLNLWGMPQALTDVLSSLVFNSIIHGFKDRTDNQVKIHCHTEGTTLVMEYSDNGGGMSSETLEKIFDPFFTTNREHGGSGLGMHIVYNIVTKKLKGKIKCESASGQGMRAVITYPNVSRS